LGQRVDLFQTSDEMVGERDKTKNFLPKIQNLGPKIHMFNTKAYNKSVPLLAISSHILILTLKVKEIVTEFVPVV